MKLIPLPAFDDNYIWMLHDGQRALVVDPGEAQPVLAALQSERVQLQSILVTHHHCDRRGAVDTLHNATGARVFGHAHAPFTVCRSRLREGTALQMWGSLGSLAKVPGTTRVCCAHAYAMSNLKFTVQVEPGCQQPVACKATERLQRCANGKTKTDDPSENLQPSGSAMAYGVRHNANSPRQRACG